MAVGATLCVPEIDLPPLQLPEAVQEVALVDDQVSVDEAPLVMLVGFAGLGFAGYRSTRRRAGLRAWRPGAFTRSQ